MLSKNSDKGGVAAVVAATVLWAIGSVLTKHLLARFDPIELIVIELAASTLSLYGILLIRGWERPSLAKCARLALPGLLQPGLAHGLAFVGLQWTSVSLETLLWSIEGAVMLPFALYFLGESVSFRTGALGVLAIAGVVVATLPTALGAGTGTMPLIGGGLILAAVLAACGYTVFAQRDLHSHDPLPLVALHQVAGLIFVIGVHLIWPFHTKEMNAPAAVEAYGQAMLAGILSFSAPFWLFLRSINVLGSAKATQFLPLVPIGTMFLASTTLGERISGLQVFGSVITIAAASALSLAAAQPDVKSSPVALADCMHPPN